MWLTLNIIYIFFVCFIIPGGADKNAVVFNKDSEQVTAILKGHTKKVNNVIYHPTEVRNQIYLYIYPLSPKLCGHVP